MGGCEITGRTVFFAANGIFFVFFLFSARPTEFFQKLCQPPTRGDHKGTKLFPAERPVFPLDGLRTTTNVSRESFADIETCLTSLSAVSSTTMGFQKQRWARSNSGRRQTNHATGGFYADFGASLDRLSRARPRPLCQRSDRCGTGPGSVCFGLPPPLNLCLSLFPWANFGQHKAAVEDAYAPAGTCHGNIPNVYSRITDGKVHDVNILDEFLPEAGCVLCDGRAGLQSILNALFVFTTLLGHSSSYAPKRMSCCRRRLLPSGRPRPTGGAIPDHQPSFLTAIDSAKAYPDPLRRVSYPRYRNKEATQVLDQQLFLLPAFDPSPQIYKCRWQVRIVFSIIGSNSTFRIKSVSTELARTPVKTQSGSLSVDLLCWWPSLRKASLGWRRVLFYPKFYRFFQHHQFLEKGGLQGLTR